MCITGVSSSDTSISVSGGGDGGTICINRLSSGISVDVSEGDGGTICTIGVSSKVTPGRWREFLGGESECWVRTHSNVLWDFVVVPQGNAFPGDSSTSELCGVPEGFPTDRSVPE